MPTPLFSLMIDAISSIALTAAVCGVDTANGNSPFVTFGFLNGAMVTIDLKSHMSAANGSVTTPVSNAPSSAPSALGVVNIATPTPAPAPAPGPSTSLPPAMLTDSQPGSFASGADRLFHKAFKLGKDYGADLKLTFSDGGELLAHKFLLAYFQPSLHTR